MNAERLKTNERKLLISLLDQLEKRIYLLRVSLYGDTKQYFPDGVIVSNDILKTDSDQFETRYKIPEEDYRLMVDSCEIETRIRRLLHEITETQTCESLQKMSLELEQERTASKKHEKMIKVKREQINHLNEVLPILKERTKFTLADVKFKEAYAPEETEKFESDKQVEILKKLMNYKVESCKAYYEHREIELKDSIEWFERETRTQGHADTQIISFWLLKYGDYTEKLDGMLKQTFDNWADKRRELDILKKYRRLNLGKIQKLHKLILEREDYIKKDIEYKDEEIRKRKEELRIEMAATLLQAYWRGTMVRKHLGPYKIKKPKKGKGKKGKGKKKK